MDAKMYASIRQNRETVSSRGTRLVHTFKKRRSAGVRKVGGSNSWRRKWSAHGQEALRKREEIERSLIFFIITGGGNNSDEQHIVAQKNETSSVARMTAWGEGWA